MATQTKKTKISSQAVMGEIKTLAMLTGGVVIGSLGGKMIDKVLKVDAAMQYGKHPALRSVPSRSEKE